MANDYYHKSSTRAYGISVYIEEKKQAMNTLASDDTKLATTNKLKYQLQPCSPITTVDNIVIPLKAQFHFHCPHSHYYKHYCLLFKVYFAGYILGILVYLFRINKIYPSITWVANKFQYLVAKYFYNYMNE